MKNKYTPKQRMYIQKNKELFKVGSKFNCYDVNLNESEEHDKKILELFFEMRRIGCYMACRQTLKNGNIPDLAVLSSKELIVKEVMNSENNSQFEAKDYPAKKIKVRI